MSDSRPPGMSAQPYDGITPPDGSTGNIPTTVMDGRFRIERVIGQGAFGRVYLAFDTRLRRNVAIKELLARRMSATDEAYARYVERFEREARAAGVVQHPNIVAVLELAVDSDSNTYLVMEYVDGTNLRDLLAQVHTLPVERVIRITREIAEALEAVHEHDIVHRDIKPANIMLTRRGVSKLADFGVAQVGHESMRTHIATSHPGTPLYMSPEQSQGYGYVDGRSDLYSLGLVLYEMLAGEPYPRRRQPLDVMAPDTPPELVAIFKRLTQKAADARFASAADLVTALNALSAAPTTPPTPLPPGSAPPPGPESQTGARGTLPPFMQSQGSASASLPSAVFPQPGTVDHSTGSVSAMGQPPPVVLAPPAVPVPPAAGAASRRGVLIAVAGAVLALMAVAVLFIVARGQSTTATPTHPPAATAASPVAQTPVTPVATARSPTVAPTATPTPAPATATATPAVTALDFSQWVTTEVAGSYRRSYDPATGEYHVTLLRDNVVQPLLSPDTAKIADFTIEVDARHVSGPDAGGYGLAFRVQPLIQGAAGHPAYLFVIDGQQRYALYEQNANGSTSFIQPFTNLPAGVMNTGTNAANHLSVTCKGDQITLAVNGKTLNTFSATITDPGTVGIVVEAPANASGVEAAFKNLRVTPVR